ncbi:uncharacterized protein LOC129602060 [Paramacrobiotus metropolitanus]|uniref:uncharacterized protein LOC129602060 n=1 Tax=Paramacrobiotus metropolitanus TaxID=2943436 RepID=UPI0024461810|nr:uncharacterized protein LOC129602060 [Paramacrobiotus metropolitanus]
MQIENAETVERYGIRIFIRSKITVQQMWNRNLFKRSDPVQQIGYVSFLPSVAPSCSQTLSNLTQQTNDWLRRNPLAGRILSVETLLIRGVEGEIDADASAWKQKTCMAALQGLHKQTFIQLYRIFYETMPHPVHEDIGFVDFVPRMLEPGGLVSYPRGEQFPAVLHALNQWASTMPGNVRLLNIQTLLTRANKQGQPLNLYNACYTDVECHEFYWRFLRLAFVAPREESASPPVYAFPTIHSRLFVAGLTRDPGWYHNAELERLSVVKERLDRWVRESGCRVMCVETVTYKTFETKSWRGLIPCTRGTSTTITREMSYRGLSSMS